MALLTRDAASTSPDRNACLPVPPPAAQESIPYSVTTVNEQGMICSQNAAARASFGAFLSVLNGGHGINFLEELFYGHAVSGCLLHSLPSAHLLEPHIPTVHPPPTWQAV